ncbi:phage tail protein [Pseudomonas putida]|uniref:phage tail protein n=1 Tax=Pseudomonas putida TaxID=303 RepID=UPI0018E6B9D3|nr:phage tail protein [Pseudomonas putida]MBI6944205.1 phage tail protein [Pseudomonas putida]MBI6960306.1 phage tail protein [Pseudomonas putida]
MTTSRELLELAVEGLKGATVVGDQVFSAWTWATWSGCYPMIYVRPPIEEKESASRNGAPFFTVTTTLRIQVKDEAPALANSAGAALLEQQLMVISDQIQAALINYPPLMGKLQRFPFIRTEMVTTSAGDTELGELEVAIGLEFVQTADDFYQLPAYPITEVKVTNDLANVFDPSGTYSGSDFPDAVQAAPRTSGPDGRAEGGFTVTLTHET